MRAGRLFLLLFLASLASLAAATDADGSTPLLWAAYGDDLPAVERLLRAGADVNAANDLGVTPLWAACQNGNEAMVRALLQAGANPNAALLAGETPLMMASRAGSAAIVELLAARGAQLDARGPRRQTALMWAAAQRHPEVVKVLLAHGAGVHLRSATWTDVMAVEPHGYLPYNRAIPHGGDTPLLFAARAGDLAVARLLLEKGASVNDADAWGVSVLAMAAHSGYRDLALFLLEKGADPNAAGPGFAPIHQAILQRDEALVSALLSHGANPNLPLTTWTPTRRSSRDRYFHPALAGATPFWLAARYLQPGVMKLLVEHGADPKLVHRSHHVTDGRFEPMDQTTTAAMAALGLGGGVSAWVEPPAAERESLALEAVRFAAAQGVDLNAANNDGRRAIDAARALNYSQVVAFLLEKGAKP